MPTSRAHPLVLVSLFKGLASAAWYHYTPSPQRARLSHPLPAASLPLPLPRPSKLGVNPRVAPLPTKKPVSVVLSRLFAAHTAIHAVQIYTRIGLVGRVVPSTRHEALEKRRCPRMYFLIIDFNDEGSRCQRHLGCWAE